MGEALSPMIEAASSVNLFRGFLSARSASMVNLLHFANNTLIFCGAEVKQIVNVKTILICFEAVSGLKVNLFKSEILRVQLSDFQLEEFADVMGCKAGSFLTSNLGLLLCLGSAFKGLWTPVIDRVEKKLTLWKATYFSLGCRIMLIQSVLSNFPIDFVSVCRCPSSVAFYNEKLKRDFFFFVARERKKQEISSVKLEQAH